MSASYATKVILAHRSGGVCAFPRCGKLLTYEAAAGPDISVSEAAHIRGERPDAARYVDAMTDAERNDIANLIYMCPYHHTVIDKAPDDFSIQYLDSLKSDHERKVREAMEAAFPNVEFAELLKAVAWVSAQAPAPTGSFDLVSPEAKIAKNNLSNGSRHLIASGMASRGTVAALIESESKLDDAFPDRLKAGFLAEYYKRRAEGATGDALFELMCSFAQRGLASHVERAAGTAVLIYLFEICDVFEK